MLPLLIQEKEGKSPPTSVHATYLLDNTQYYTSYTKNLRTVALVGEMGQSLRSLSSTYVLL